MCGIAGIYLEDANQVIDRERLKRMTDSIQHRGPDAEGFFVERHIGLGHRRLSIIDLETGDQPMIDQESGSALIFNGEIYNYLELRSELAGLGHIFTTSSDTEVVLRSYLEWGTECLGRFNGMWAIAIWNQREKQLFLARDRIGIKPLHFFHDGKQFLFASEIKGIFAAGIRKELNTEMLDIYLSLGYIPAPYTFYKNIHKLMPGHYMLVRDGNISIREYWNLPHTEEGSMLKDKAEIHERFEYLLTDAVKLRMRSDVPFGAFLSGGLDSASIVTLMAGTTTIPVETFTIGFDEPDYDERELARAVAHMQHTHHHEQVVAPDSFEEALKTVSFHYDEPFGDSSAIPTGHISRFAASRVKMVLTGDGGDEVLSGYPSYQVEKFVAGYNRIPGFVRHSGHTALRLLGSAARGKTRYRLNRYERLLRTASEPFQQSLLAKSAWLDQNRRHTLLRNYKVFPVEEYLAGVMKDCRYQDTFYQLMYFHLKVSLPDDMLTKVDRMSMAYSLEARVPFLDYRLVEFMSGVDKGVKLQGTTRKSVLRDTIGKRLPSQLLTAKKRGFVVPLREWFKQENFTANFSRIADAERGLDKSLLGEIFEQNRSGSADHGNLIWMLFLLHKAFENA